MVKRNVFSFVSGRRKRQRTSSMLDHDQSDMNFLGSYHGRPVGSATNLPPRKIMTSVLNKSAKRAAMSVYGKKPKVKKGKKVKVSKVFRDKVLKVNAAHIPYGEYKTCHVGYLGFIVPGTAALAGVQLETYSDQNGVPQIAASWPGTDMGSYARCLFSMLFTAGTGSTTSVAGTEMMYFTPMKFLDIASKLWNQKQCGNRSYASTTGNLSTVFDKTTGAAVVGTTSTNTLKIEVVNSYVTWDMKNVSQRPLKLVIHEMTPKLKFLVDSPIDQMSDALATVGDTTGEQRYYGIFQGAVSTTTPNAQYGLADPMVNLGNLEGLQWKKGQRREILIQPGESCQHSIKGPRRTTVDFAKLVDGGTEKWAAYGVKGYTVACVVEVILDPQLLTATSDLGFRPTARTGTAKVLVDPLQITVTEVAKIRCPEVVGFMNPNAFAANSNQQLNLRKKRVHIENWSSAQGTTAVAYTGYNEENPITGISTSNSF